VVAVPVEVGEGFWVVGDHGIKIQGLRVGEVCVGDGDGDGRPVSAVPAVEAVGVIASAEIVVHSDLEATNVYTHALPDSQRRAVERVSEVMFSSSAKRNS
jgi:hypothetical protein